jgi:hypothetical protein
MTICSEFIRCWMVGGTSNNRSTCLHKTKFYIYSKAMSQFGNIRCQQSATVRWVYSVRLHIFFFKTCKTQFPLREDKEVQRSNFRRNPKVLGTGTNKDENEWPKDRNNRKRRELPTPTPHRTMTKKRSLACIWKDRKITHSSPGANYQKPTDVKRRWHAGWCHQGNDVDATIICVSQNWHTQSSLGWLNGIGDLMTMPLVR